MKIASEERGTLTSETDIVGTFGGLWGNGPGVMAKTRANLLVNEDDGSLVTTDELKAGYGRDPGLVIKTPA